MVMIPVGSGGSVAAAADCLTPEAEPWTPPAVWCWPAHKPDKKVMAQNQKFIPRSNKFSDNIHWQVGVDRLTNLIIKTWLKSKQNPVPGMVKSAMKNTDSLVLTGWQTFNN